VKLLFILPEYRREPAGGIRTFYCHLLPALAAAGCQVEVLVVHRDRFDAPSFTDVGGVKVEYLRSAIFEKHSRSVAASFMAGYPTLGHFVPMGLAAYEQANEGDGYDLVELTDWPLYFLPWVCRGPLVPFTISLHSSIGQMRFFGRPPGGAMEDEFIRLIEAAAFTAAPSVHTNSNLNAKYWEGIIHRKVEVLLPLVRHNNVTGAEWRMASEGLDVKSGERAVAGGQRTEFGGQQRAEGGDLKLEENEQKFTKNGRERGAIFARLQNWKGAELLCEALRLVPEVSVDWYGRSVAGSCGNGSYENELREKFPDVFCRQFLHRSEVGHEEALRAMRMAGFVCVPSLWDVFNLTVIEAMQQGQVVLCSEKAGAEMLIEEGVNGFLFDPSSAQSLASGLLKCQHLSEEERERIGRRAVATIQRHFAAATLVQQRLDYYRAAARTGSPGASHALLRPLLDFPSNPFVRPRTLKQKIASRLMRLLSKCEHLPQRRHRS
jgi:glycosyltransferase involved in cell wall biosynthesis